jgi:hypothetical protein
MGYKISDWRFVSCDLASPALCLENASQEAL